MIKLSASLIAVSFLLFSQSFAQYKQVPDSIMAIVDDLSMCSENYVHEKNEPHTDYCFGTTYNEWYSLSPSGNLDYVVSMGFVESGSCGPYLTVIKRVGEHFKVIDEMDCIGVSKVLETTTKGLRDVLVNKKFICAERLLKWNGSAYEAEFLSIGGIPYSILKENGYYQDGSAFHFTWEDVNQQLHLDTIQLTTNGGTGYLFEDRNPLTEKPKALYRKIYGKFELIQKFPYDAWKVKDEATNHYFDWEYWDQSDIDKQIRYKWNGTKYTAELIYYGIGRVNVKYLEALEVGKVKGTDFIPNKKSGTSAENYYGLDTIFSPSGAKGVLMFHYDPEPNKNSAWVLLFKERTIEVNTFIPAANDVKFCKTITNDFFDLKAIVNEKELTYKWDGKKYKLTP